MRHLMIGLMLLALSTACGGESVTVAPGGDTESGSPTPMATAEPTPSDPTTSEESPEDPLAPPELTVRSGAESLTVKAFTFCVSGPDPKAPSGSGEVAGMCADGFPTPTAHPVGLAADRQFSLEIDRPWKLEVSLYRLDESGCMIRRDVPIEQVGERRWRVPESVAADDYALDVFAKGGGDGAFAVLLAVGEPGSPGEVAPADTDPPGMDCR